MDIKMINSIEDLQSIFGKFKIAKLEISKILEKKKWQINGIKKLLK